MSVGKMIEIVISKNEIPIETNWGDMVLHHR